MDAAKKSSSSDTATETIDGGIASLVSGKRMTSEAAPYSDALAAGVTSIADIERLMAELLVARDYLQAEGERVRHINANFTHLAQTASASVKVIAERIGQWRLSEPANLSVVDRVPLSTASEDELQPNGAEPSP